METSDPTHPSMAQVRGVNTIPRGPRGGDKVRGPHLIVGANAEDHVTVSGCSAGSVIKQRPGGE